MQGCGKNCGCKNCENPNGKGLATEPKTISRKRRKHDNTPKTSGDFSKITARGFLTTCMWNDYDHFILQQIVYSHVTFGEQEPDYDRLYEAFLFVLKLTVSAQTNVQDMVIKIIKTFLHKES